MLIEGSATGHGWRVKGAILQGVFEVEPAWQTDLTLASVQCLGEGKTPPKCVLAIPVVTLKSQVSVGSGIMDGRMREELKAAQHRSIQYELTEMKLAGAVPPSGSPVTFDTRGRLAIAGQTNTVSFQVVMERPAADRLTFTGSYKTKMTEFGVTPPEFTVLGVGSRTADDITLSWKWTVGLQPLGR
ncbi:MAG: YceI family protein [Verrucomicrobia bacterium]|nr:YceI family protein [Verrucomicrobiota bacterium]